MMIEGKIQFATHVLLLVSYTLGLYYAQRVDGLGVGGGAKWQDRSRVVVKKFWLLVL